MRFLAICGSLRAASTNRVLLEAFARHAPEGIAVRICEEIRSLPLFDPDRDGEHRPLAVVELARQVGEADGLIVASPEYAHGIPGPLKNALDWLVSGSEIPNKPVMLVHASVRGLSVREHLSEVLRTMSTRLQPGLAFEMHLVGKSQGEAREMLDRSETRERLAGAIAGFAAFVTDPDTSAKG
ncbi:NADPH-dependent FMN reductase [Mesorhizobium koreense]|jgi:NAD(P)H-dependent FMN reductase|uniref:NADPH-dependent FMN reductase n=1 Tax=Mesorhizobium koreense TaxID=3074855 RepID=UPI00287B7137|nr:NADPH-dependent FMN reductase [Mesorhizobium sp. WR6]